MRFLILVPLCLLAFSLKANVIISEFLASNQTILQDEDADYPDYIELWNTGSGTVSLGGHFLTDKIDNLTKWQIPAVSLGAGERIVIFASGKDRSNPAGTLHTNFSLSAAGEYLGLIGPDGVSVLDAYSPTFPPQYEDVAFGVLDAELGEPTFLVPSPGGANTEVFAKVVSPTFSVPHGFYTEPFTLYLNTDTFGGQIYYTLNGANPGPLSGTLYNPATGIEIDDTRVVRAVTVLSGYPPSFSATHSYIFLETVVNQSNNQLGRGFPSVWKSRPADYAMDPRIEIEPSDLTTIPSVSIVLPQEDWWNSSTGIYVNSQKRASNDIFWERAGSIEYFDPNSDTSFAANTGVRIFGGAARQEALSDKMGLRVVFRSTYGLGRAETDIFDRVGDNANKINTIVLRSHWGSSFLRDSTRSGWSGQTDAWEALYMRDVFTNELYRATGNLNVRSMMVHLYLNGLYFGLYEAIERPDDAFNAENRGGQDEDYDVIKGDSAYTSTNGRLHSGTIDAYRRLFSFFDTNADGSNKNTIIRTPVTDEELEIVGQYLDLKAFADHMITFWLVNRLDFPNKNWYGAAKRGEPGGPPEQPFIFFTWDSEATLWFDRSFNRKISWNERSVVERWNLSPSHDIGQIRLYRRLILNEKFRQLWADRAYELMFNDGPLSRENILAQWDALAAELDRAIIGESARWGDWTPLHKLNPVTRADWLKEVKLVRDHILDGRNDLTIAQMREFNAYPELDPPVFMNAGGLVWPEDGVRLARIGNEGVIKYTLNGSDPRDGGTSYDGPFMPDRPIALRTALVSGEKWSAATEQTLMPLGGLPLAITEIMYNPGAAVGVDPANEGELEFLEITNVGPQSVSLQDVALTDGVNFDFNQGSVGELAPGASVLVVRHLELFEQVYGTGLPVAGQYEGNLSNSGERLELSVAGFVLQSFRYEDKEPWVELADGGGYSLVLSGYELDPALPTSWEASEAIGGAPGTWTALVGTSDPWASSSEQYGTNWRHQPTYGSYYVAGDQSIYHRHHGWLTVYGDAPSNWWFDYNLGWLYTSSSYYPFIYSVSQQTWLYYLIGSANPRWFYDYGTQGWSADKDLK